MRQSLLAGVAVSALLTSLTAIAEVATDGTMGAKVRLAGRDVTIGADLGSIRGKNLFHSFERFDIATGGSATFTGPAGLDRVISRVTGGQASSIDGTLRSTVPGADVYLVNPSGILFGPNARLDVPASFHASTADELRFPGGGVFSASDPSRTVLSVAAPEAFGFLGARPASITLNQGRLEVGVGRNLSLVGGAIAVTGSGVAAEAGVLRTPGGELTLASIGGKGTVSLGSDAALFDPDNDQAFRHGAVDLSAGALLTSTGDGGGKIRIRSGRLSLAENVGIYADNNGPTNSLGGVIVRAGTIDVTNGSAITADVFDSGAAGDVTVTVNGRLNVLVGEIGSSTFASGDAGRVTLQVGSLTIDGAGADRFTGIDSRAERYSTGAAGQVTITAKSTLEIMAGGRISSSTFATGDGGSVVVQARRLTIDGSAAPELPTGISGRANDGTGGAGDVTVTVEGKLEVLGSGEISGSTFADGDAGRVSVRAGSLKIDGTATPDLVTGIFSNADEGSAGAAGEVNVAVDGRLQILAGVIASSTAAIGDAGRVSVRAGSMKIDRPSETDLFIAGINSDAKLGSTGAAGEVEVEVDENLVIRGGGAIGSGTFAGGDGGRVTIRAGTLKIDGSSTPDVFTGIISSAEPDSTGTAGEVTVTVDGRLDVLGGGEITSSTAGAGNAGRVTVQVGDLAINGSKRTDFDTGIFSDALEGSTGAAGEVNVIADGRLEVLAVGLISSSTLASGDAGRVSVQAGTLRVLAGGVIESSTSASGDAARVTVRAGNLTIDGSGTSAETGIFSDARKDSTGAAGEVTVTVDKGLLVRGGGVIGSGSFASGDAGRVVVQAGRLEIFDGGIVDSSTFASGDAGRVNVRAGSLTVDGSATRALTGIFSDAREDSTGAAGEVTVTVDKGLLVRGGGVIGSNTFASGDAGSLTVEAGNLKIDGSGSRIGSNAERGSGAAGEVTVTVDEQLQVLDGGEIGSSNFGTGSAGDVAIEAGELRAKSGSILSSSARDLGGRLTIRAGKQLTLVGSEVSTNGTLPAGEASVISLSATTVLLSDSLVTALTGDGQPLVGAGVVDITAKRTFISKDSEVLGSSAVNIAGVINNLLAPTRPAPPAPTDPSRLLRDCAEERLGGRGSFKATGRGGLPASPEEFLTGGPAKGTGKPVRVASAGCTSD